MGASGDDTALLERDSGSARDSHAGLSVTDSRPSRESASMRMKLTHVTPMLVAGAAAIAIAAAPAAAAEPAAAQITPSTAVASHVVPIGHGGGGGFHGGGGGFHGGGFHGGYGGDRGGFYGDRGGWGWPWGWDRRW
jgi:hypothetical protein